MEPEFVGVTVMAILIFVVYVRTAQDKRSCEWECERLQREIERLESEIAELKGLEE